MDVKNAKKWDETKKLAQSFGLIIECGSDRFFIRIERESMGGEKYIDQLDSCLFIDEVYSFVKGFAAGVKTRRLNHGN